MHEPAHVVLITGAAGGLGQGLMAAFAGAGWHVAAGYHANLPQLSGDCLWPIPLDVATPDRPERAVAEIIERWGRLDALINNAGVAADAPFVQLSDEAWDHVLAVNLKGAMACARAAVWPMIRLSEKVRPAAR